MRLVLATLALLTAAWLTLAAALAEAPPGSDPNSETSKWYRSLERPDLGGSCCDVSDCRPVESRSAGDHFEAFVDRKTFGVEAPDAWLSIPNEKLLHNQRNLTGRAVLCWLKSTGPMCFVRPWET